MVYTYNLPNMTGGFDSGIADVVSIVPAFIPMFLMATYFIIMLGGVLSQKAKTGYADVPLWSTIASLSTLMIALAMTLRAGIIEPLYVTLLILLTIMSGVWLFLDTNRNEV